MTDKLSETILSKNEALFIPMNQNQNHNDRLISDELSFSIWLHHSV
jgi:hypothetical protein